MPANKTAAPSEKKTIPPALIVLALALVAGVAAFFYLNRAANRPPALPPPLTQEARRYVGKLQLANVEIKAHTSYLNQQVVEITGNVTNAGDRRLSLVEINCVFYDAYGQLVLRQRVAIVGRRMGGLGPGETKQFRLPFDNIPESWNQVIPQLVIANIQFQ